MKMLLVTTTRPVTNSTDIERFNERINEELAEGYRPLNSVTAYGPRNNRLMVTLVKDTEGTEQ